MNALTIEQLKSLAVGEWVYLTNADRMYGTYVKKLSTSDDEGFAWENIETLEKYKYSEYSLDWLAYRNKQEAEAKGEQSKRMITFRLNGCDISFAAVAPADMTVEQLVKQGNRIEPDWCACGICAEDEDYPPEIIFDYDDVKVANDDVNCTIKDKE